MNLGASHRKRFWWSRGGREICDQKLDIILLCKKEREDILSLLSKHTTFASAMKAESMIQTSYDTFHSFVLIEYI
jgi:hypothetical protein